MLNIGNRRYIGNKTKLLNEIFNCAEQFDLRKDYTFADLFAGTGVVAHLFASKGHHTILNDLLYSNYVAYQAWFSSETFTSQKIENYINYFNSINPAELENNYFSDIYGGKYFSINDSKKIGFIRQYLEDNKALFNEREYFILLTALLYFTDKIANTVGHFEYFLSKKPEDTTCKIENLNIKQLPTSEIFNIDSNVLAKQIESDVVYIDPPYNARQYVNFYHVLENLARWNKPNEFEGNSMKFKRDTLKSGYSRATAPLLFEDLINSLKCKLIIVSYSNTYSAKSGASINKISEEQIISILSRKGKVQKKEIDYKAFNSGKTDLKNHKEYIFTCEVNL